MSDWNWGGAFAQTLGELQRQDQAAEAQPYNLSHLASIARLQNAQAGEAETRATADQQAAKALQGIDFTASRPSVIASKIAQTYAAAGNPTAANAALTHAASLEAHEAQSDLVATRQRQYDAQERARAAQRLGELMIHVNDQAGLDRANAIWQSEFPDQTIPDAAKTYSPEMVNSIFQGSKAYVTKLKTDLLNAAEQRKAEAASVQETLRAAQAELARARAAALDRKQVADGKAGGKDVGMPATSEVTAAKNILKAQGVYGQMDQANGDQAALALASAARAIRKQSGGNLDADQALQQAYTAEQSRGAYRPTAQIPTTVGGVAIPGMSKTQPGGYNARGASGNQPPPTINSPEELAKYPTGSLVNIKGKTYKYLGNGRVDEVR